MSSGKRSAPIVQLVGPDGSGKTTLCRLLLNAFTDKSVLAVDSSIGGLLINPTDVMPDTQLPTLATLISKMEASALTREALDWALQDLPVPVPAESDCDILLLGKMPTALYESQLDLLTYGLPRLFSHYEVVIWDGPFGILAPILDKLDAKPLIVVTPQDETYCRQLQLDPHFQHATVLLSKALNSDVLPPCALEAVHNGSWKLVGKLPVVSPTDERIPELPQYFQDCFHKLDLPFELRSP